MAYDRIYKDIGIEDEATWGASTGANLSKLHITSVDLTKSANKKAIEETSTSNKGRVRMYRQNNSIEGSLSMYASPRNLNHALELANGMAGTSSAFGTSHVTKTYYQATTSTLASKTINIDRVNSQEKFSGCVAKTLEISGSDDLLELSLDLFAKGYTNTGGVSMDDTAGETVKPFTFADVVIKIYAGATLSADPITLRANEWSVNYDNGLESIYQSGDGTNDGRDPARFILGIPELTGSFQVIHEGSTWVNATYGCSEWYMSG
jgi:hypothetical protein